MKRIEINELKDNFFETIGKEWMLVTAGKKDSFNMMTASWGCIGWLWNMPVAVIFIRPERYTHEIIEKEEELTLSFLGNSKEIREVYNICGSKSGRNCDKIKETGLHPLCTENGNVSFEEARLTLVCRKLYKDNLKENNFIDKSLTKWYGEKKGGYHDVYILEIKECLVK